MSAMGQKQTFPCSSRMSAKCHSPTLTERLSASYNPSSGDRHRKVEHRTTALPILRPDPAAVALDNSTRDRQSKPGALRLGGHECLENAFKFVRGDAGAAI